MPSSADNPKGFRLLPDVLDRIGTATPDRIYASVPRSHDMRDGFRDLSCGQILRAVDSLALWILERHGKSEIFETLAYVGISDLRYAIVFFAAVKCGFKVLFISPRNALHQNVSLLEQTECSKLLHSPEFGLLADSIKQARLEAAVTITDVIAPLDHWIEKYTKPFPFQKTFEEAANDPLVVLHSSGSTGAPKPIIQTHQFFANLDRPLPPLPGREFGGPALFDYEGGGAYFSPFPCFHLAGFHSQCFYPVFGRSASLVMGYPDRPATAEITLEVMKQTRLRVLYAPPSIIENLVQMPGAMDLVKRIEHVIYAGGPLGKSCGDTLSEYTKLSSIYGSTETATVACVVPRREDWQYLEFHPIWKPDMEAIGDGTFEMVVKKDDEADKFRGIGGTILISEPEYRSRDLFIAHPTKKGLWRFYGRKDDILVLSNGEKWNPVPSEGVILEHPGVSAVLAVGNGMFQPGAIIEAAGTVTQEKEFIDSVWPFVERANRVAQRHGRIVRSRIAVVDPGAFLRSPKGTVVRRTTEKKLQSIIDGWLETSLDSDSAFERDKLSDADCSPAGTLQVIRDCCQSIEVLEDIQDHEDIFTKGLDSLEVIELAKNIKNRFAAMSGNRHTTFVNQQLIFRYPTLEKLAYKLYQEFLSHQTDGYEDSCDDLKIPDLIEKYSTQLGQARPESPQMHLVLTGSTGSLGQEILRTFLKSPEVSLVTCLDRDAKARSKAESKFGSQYRHAWNKVNFMTVDFQKPYLGLTEQELGFFETVHAIIHCAWRVNFNQTLASFELHIRALCELRSIVSRSYWKPRLCFVSSMSAVANYSCTGSEGTVIPEEIVYDDAAALPMGYGQSKYVAERILANAANDLEIPITILRLGQVAGTVQDATKECQASSETTRPWNPAEWVPSLIATSGALGQLPSDLPPVDWIPANRTAKIILELVLHDVSSDETLSVYNLVNPRSSSWSSLIPAIQEGLKGQCKLLHYSAWLQKLRELDVESKGNVARYPALRIMTYLEQKEARGRSILYTTTRATARSSTMANLEPVSAEWMGQWMEQWHFV